MRTRVLSTLTLGAIAIAATVRGQDRDLPELQVSPAIAARMHWVQQRMVSGRVVAASGVSVPRTFVQLPGKRLGRRETLTLEISAGLCHLQYESTANDDRLKISLAGNDDLSVHRDRPQAQYVLDFRQRPGHPLSLVLEQGDTKRAWQAQGFWQLYMAEPDVVRTHLVPLLEMLRTSWQLSSTAVEIEDAMLRAARASSRPVTDRGRWQQLVETLGSPTFSDRESAQRELYRSGQIVVPYLQSLDHARLDREQTSRIRALIESLSADDEDTPERVATWLIDDPRAWLSLLTREDAARRSTAAAELTRLTGRPIEFDPQASAEERAAQLEKLRTGLEGLKDDSQAED